MLSTLADDISLEERSAIVEQRVRENDAQVTYLETRHTLFDVLKQKYPGTIVPDRTNEG